MKSFTASTRLGPVKVRFADDTPPQVWQDGRQIAAGVPEVVAWDHQGAEGELVCLPSAVWVGRTATLVARAKNVALLSDIIIDEDTAVAQTRGVLIVDGVGSLWGVQADERKGLYRGLTLDGETMQPETWHVAMAPIKRACCGRSVTATPITVPLLGLAFPLP